MKKLLIALLSGACLLGSCSEDKTDGGATTNHIDISSKTILADSKGQTAQITVTSSGDWRLAGICDWAHPSATSGRSGDVVTFTVDPNTTEDVREATFKFFTGSAVVALDITSELGNYIRLVTDPQVTLTRAGGKFILKLKTNLEELTTSFSGDGANWVTFDGKAESLGASLMSFTAEANDKTEGRSTVLTIAGAGVDPVEVTIGQSQKNAVELADSKLEYDLSARTISIEVTANVDYAVAIDGSWITEAPKGRAMVTETLTLHLDAATTSRAGSITFTGGGLTKTVSIIQKAPGAVVTLIPDPTLREWFVSKGWVSELEGGLCEIQQAGLDATEFIYEPENYYADNLTSAAGVEAFENLESITIKDQNLTSFDISALQKVKTLDIDNNGLTEIILGNNPVETITITNLSHYSYALYSYVYPTSVTISGSHLKSLDISYANKWGHDELAVVDVSGCPVLETLNCERVVSSAENPYALKTIYLKEGQSIPNMKYAPGVEIKYKK